MNLAEAAVKVVGDFSQLRRDAASEADRAAQTFGSRFRSGATRALGAGLAVGGAAIAGAAAVGTRGVIELDNAMADYQATTGATVEEVERAAETTEELFRGNLGVESYAAAAEAQAALRTELGLTEEQIDESADAFLDWARVTGQTAPEAISNMDDILDAYNLDASESVGIMDQLTASHQQFGTDVGASASVLGRLAPQLTAANLELDDGVGLLNLFAASGVDASKAPQALTAALSKVESPEELQQLIEDIAATEDPFERAQLAIDLFGSRAGPQLANALAGTSGNLQDFAISSEDAAGATEEAAEAMDSSFGRQAQLWIRNIQGMATDMVQSLGPGIGGVAVAASTAAPALRGMGRGLGNLSGMIGPKLLTGLLGLGPIVATAGGAIGTAFTAAASVAIAAWPVVLIGLVVGAIALLLSNPELREKALEIGGAIVRFIGEALGKLVEVLGAVLGMIASWGAQVVQAVAGVVGRIVEFFLSIPGRVAGFVGALFNLWLTLWQRIIALVIDGVSQVVGFVLAIPGRVAGFVGALIGLVVQAVQGLIDNFIRGAQVIVETVLSIPGRVIALVARLIGIAGDAIRGVIGAFIRGVGRIVDLLLGLPGRVIGGITSGFANLGRAAFDAFMGFITGIPGAVGDVLGGIGDFVGGLIPSFDVGTDYVPKDMLAMVHKGEMIVPAEEAAAIRGARGNMPSASVAGSAGGGDTIHVYLQGLVKARTTQEVGEGLAQLARHGRLSRRVRFANE